MSRLSKSSTERIYLLSATQASVEHWVFKVRGQSNKIYEQNLKTISFSCSCPDHAIRKSFCKHLLFLISRVAINPSLARELYNDKSKWGIDVFNILNKVWIERLQNRMNNIEKKTKLHKNAIGNDCSICFEEMKNGEVFTQCITTCKNYFHEDCLKLWLNTGKDTCPLCRGKWCKTKDSAHDIIDNSTEISILVLQEPSILPPVLPVIQPVIEPIVQNNNIITVNNEGTIKEICNINNLQYSKGRVYYEFIKTEKINNKKKIILMERSTGYLFEGSNALAIMGLDETHEELTLKPGMLSNYTIFIQSTSSNRKLLKNQKIVLRDI
jgi:hypothetical protein